LARAKLRGILVASVIPLVGFDLMGCTVYTNPPQSDVVVVSHAPPPPPPVYAPPPPPDGVVVDAPSDPPPPQVEVVGVAPWPDGYWIGGHYVWRGGGWWWSSGYWGHRPYYGAVWSRGYYRRGPRGMVWVAGRWR